MSASTTRPKGCLIAVVGPSGVGKDSVMAGLKRAAPQLQLVRRSITRPPELGGEDFDHLPAAGFETAAQAGAFCLHWQAHGLRYGIPAAALQQVNTGQICLANLSRAVLSEAAEIFACLKVLHLTARPETLARRLAGRGRESAADIARRLDRTAPSLPKGLTVIEIANDGPLAQTVSAALAALDLSAPAPIARRQLSNAPQKSREAST